MSGMLVAESAKFGDLYSVRIILLVLERVIITLFAFAASKSYLDPVALRF